MDLYNRSHRCLQIVTFWLGCVVDLHRMCSATHLWTNSGRDVSALTRIEVKGRPCSEMKCTFGSVKIVAKNQVGFYRRLSRNEYELK